jgi:hypothetical protein
MHRSQMKPSSSPVPAQSSCAHRQHCLQRAQPSPFLELKSVPPQYKHSTSSSLSISELSDSMDSLTFGAFFCPNKLITTLFFEDSFAVAFFREVLLTANSLSFLCFFFLLDSSFLQALLCKDYLLILLLTVLLSFFFFQF